MKSAVVASLLAATTTWVLVQLREPGEVTAGFWFEPVSYESRWLDGPLSATDIETIAAVARHELAIAFQPFRVTLTDRRDARFSVRVVQELIDHRTKRKSWIAGRSYVMRGFGGSGEVSFIYFASGAMSYAPPNATRAEFIAAIGRGIGRSAAHEFAHLFLAGHDEHPTKDTGSYEYHAASRPEQYFGPMHWDVAGPMLEQRLGRRHYIKAFE